MDEDNRGIQMSDSILFTTLDEYRDYLRKTAKSNPKVKASYELLWEDESDEAINCVMDDESLSNQEFIESIALCRLNNYKKASGGANKAAENETDRLYAKNSWKFVEEFLQNADDCDYETIPEISIVVDERDEKHCFIEFIYNEEGFSRNDIWAITAFSESTKVNDTVKKQIESGVFYKEKTGRKGKGFKSVFSLNAENVIVHIRSNGFSFKLDNRIGRIMPVWENDPARMDGKTHVVVELLNPLFSVKEIYPEFRRLFCVDHFEEIFANSPFLFMHRIRMVHVTQISVGGEKTFITEYREDSSKTIYAKPFSLNPEKVMLAGIAKDGVFYEEQYQEGEITTLSGEGDSFVIPLIRYTRMVEDDECYRNYSVMAPLIKAGDRTEWKGGALFRTFPMSLHPIMMPISIDAPFILNPDRSGIQYSSYKDEEGTFIPASSFNTEVSKRLFEENGVFEAFFLWLRSITDIRIDRYLKPFSMLLFEDKNNSDGHGNTWVPQYDIGKLCQSFPIFKLLKNENSYVSYENAWLINKDFFKWPCIETLLSFLLGEDYKTCILSDLYVGSTLFQAKPIVKPGFVDGLNKYLDVVERKIGIDSVEMFSFFNRQLYPFINENARLLNRVETDAFKRMQIYYSCIQEGDHIHIVRESCLQETKWIHDENGEKRNSINRYRIYESSPTNIAILGEAVENVLGRKSLYMEFGEANQATVSSRCKTWEAIRDYIEAVTFYGFSNEKLRFQHLQKYVLSKQQDPEFNAFRDTGLLTIINEDDVRRLSHYYSNSSKKTVWALKQMGVKSGDDYFQNEGTYLTFREDTLKLLQLPSCPVQKVLKGIRKKKEDLGKKINADYKAVESLREDVLLYFLDESNGLFSMDSYVDICDNIQIREDYWGRQDTTAAEILIRACAGAASTLPGKTKKSRGIEIDIETVLRDHLESSIANIRRKNVLQKLIVSNNGFFEEITPQEITPLLSLLGCEKEMSNVFFYKGNMACFGGKKLFLRDFRGGNVYLHCNSSGDYREALEECVKKRFDAEKLRYYDEMEQQYRDVKERVIVPLFNRTEHNLSRTYDEIERRFDEYDKREIISILSWFRAQGYTNALGNGNINNEQEIEDDYRDEPWKFVYEFIQNVDDCEYEDETPALTVIVSKNKGKIVFEYNEVGFSLDDVKALTKFGDSNKAELLDELNTYDGIFDREKTGRKGRGFKSVFAIPGDDLVVHISSNGFSFKFVKRLGYIIPIWEDISDTLSIGTRITIDGLQEKYIDKLVPNLRALFGVKDTAAFFSTCPVLFLRKLESVTIINDEEQFSIDINPLGIPRFTEASPDNVKKEIAGIRHKGRLRQACIEDIKITINVNQESKSFDAIKYTRAITVGDCSKILQVISPIEREDSELFFNKGALYRTLPLSDHIFTVPLAINGPFDTNSGRSKVEDNENNDAIAQSIGGAFLTQFFLHLRKYRDIKIEKYIPGQADIVFKDYKTVAPLNLYAKIRSFAILKKYGQEGFVSCNLAKALPVECYKWQNPDMLSECFDSTNGVLVDEQYAGNSFVKKKIDLICPNFVQNMNNYLDKIKLDGPDYADFLKKHIYPYIIGNYDSLLRKYREEDRLEELKGIRIFVFKMADGSYVRESADSECIWIKNMPEQYYSFGNFRSLSNSSICDVYSKNNLEHIFPDVEEYDSAFTGEKLRTRRANSWDQVKQLIESLLYYDVKRDLRIPYLDRCVLSEDLDMEENLFRIAYERTANHEIIDHIITSEDLCSIRNNVTGKESLSVDDIADSIRQMGIRKPDDFFLENGRGILHLNKETIAILESYCLDRETAAHVLKTIDTVFLRESQKKNVSLHITYEDIINSAPIVFSKLFEYEVLRGDTERHLAGEFCKRYPKAESCDYKEAYLRALNVIGEADKPHSIIIELSEILSRGLGLCLQNCKIQNLEKLSLAIEIDEEVHEYPSEETEKALKWLDDEKNSVSVTYDYYTADLSKAFSEGTDASHRYLFDDTVVIVDSDDPQNSMLQFVQGRYKGKDASFKDLLLIISEQNKLRSPWKGTKEEYVEDLKKFRTATLMKQKVLFPDFDKHLNDANGKALDYVIPELLQNINDCKAGKGQDTRTLDVSICPEDGSMMLQYDEAGFDFSNVYSITAIGQSSKHDESEGEKGLGFKKVFSLFEVVEIYSNGFCFSLNAEKNTIPVWIQNKEKQKKYMKDGKTTMLFFTSGSHKQKLSVVLDQWKELMSGQYIGNKISPIFLKNIDYIYLEGYNSHYSKTEMEKNYIFIKTPLLTFYNKVLQKQGIEAKEHIKDIRQRLKTRRKCNTMSEEEKEKYLETLNVEVAIPRRITKDNRGKGCFYSTLPTERTLYTTLFINVPLELTTGRDGIIEDSEYNKTVFELLFVPYNNSCPAVFSSILETFAYENKDLFALDYIYPDTEVFVEKLASILNIDESVLYKELEKTDLFQSYGNDDMVSIASGYSVDHILYLYCKKVNNRTNDIEDWLHREVEEIEGCSLLRLSTKEQCEHVEGFAKIVHAAEGYYPLVDKERDIVLDYLSCEYGYVEEVGEEADDE